MKKMMSIAASVLVASVLAAAQSDPVWVKVAAAGSTAEAKAAADFARTEILPGGERNDRARRGAVAQRGRDARDFEKKTIYKHFTVEDPSRSCGGRFVNFYNAKQLLRTSREPLVKPSADFDRTHAHKPWVLKHDGVVYHYYCAVGGKGRGIALATSEP